MKKKPNRKVNDFNAATVKFLRESVNNHCSKPDCWKRTLGPSKSLTKKKKNRKISITGDAAHINGATELAARWENLPSSYLSSDENGIWLCKSHAKMIDDDEDTYTVDLLKEWKNKAINRAKSEHGNSPPNPNESSQIVRSMISGEAGLLKPKPLVHTIRCLLKASSEGYEKLDPRFKVLSTIDNNITNFQIHAKEEVSLNLKISSGKNESLLNLMDESIKHGTSISLPMANIKIEGSKLFSYIFDSNDGNLSIIPQPIVARDTLFMINPKSGLKEYFEVIDGNIVKGTESYTFIGKGLGGFLKFSYRRYKDKSSSSVDMSFKLDLWDKKDVNSLLGFDKLKLFIEKMNQGWMLVVSSEVKGKVMLETKPSSLIGLEQIKALGSLLYYIESAQKLSEISRTPIVFDFDNLPNSNESFNAVYSAVDELKEEDKIYEKDSDEKFSFDVKTSELKKPYLKKLIGTKKSINFNAVKNSTVTCFGQEINLPTIEIQFRGYIPRKIVTEKDIEKSEIVRLSYYPTKGSKRTIKLLYEEKECIDE